MSRALMAIAVIAGMGISSMPKGMILDMHKISNDERDDTSRDHAAIIKKAEEKRARKASKRMEAK